jgi:hypothetical protein
MDSVGSILDFIDTFKYQPRGLWDSLSAPSPEALRVKTLLEEETRNRSDWPTEFRCWQAGALGLLASQIATVASPFLRHDAAQELFELAEQVGFSRAQIGMLCGEMAPLEAFANRTPILASRT